MEIRIYKSFDLRRDGKTLFCSRVSCMEVFSFERCIDTFRAIYGSDCVIEFLVV